MAIIKVIKDGNIWDTETGVIVITVNCVGAMGAGIALQVRNRWPEVYEKYRGFCRAGKFKIGQLYLTQVEPDLKLLLFPTKDDWKNPSKIEYIELGLQNLCETYEKRGLSTLAMPMLGCSNGRLKPWVVEPIIHKILSETDLEIELYK